MSTWVFLRGLMRERRHWGDFPDIFRQALPDARVVAPDLPGNGEHHRLPSATKVGDMVEFCRQELSAAGHAPPYRLLALSLGGMVAVEWSARYPDEVACAVLINTSMRPFSRFTQRLRWSNYPALLGLALLGGVERQERLLLRLTSRDGAARGGVLERWLAYQRQCPVSRLNALRQLLSAARYRAPRRRPAPPLLVLSGEGDRLVDPRCSRQLASAWQLPCCSHATAGHDLPLDEAHWVSEAVLRWIRAQRI